MASLFEKIFGKKMAIKRYLRELHIETSFACNLSCIMCPMSAQIKGQGLMNYETFSKILPNISLFKRVALSGFGEPLIHKEIVKMVYETKKHSVFTNMSTNGLLLSSNLAKELIDANLDLITFSIDAAKKETYEKIRIGSRFEQVLENIENFTNLCLQKGCNTYTQWIYVLMENNLDEVVDALRLSKELGVIRFVVKHMETATDTNELTQALFNTFLAPDLSKEEIKKRDQVLDELKSWAEKLKMYLVIHPIKTKTCIAYPVENLFIDYKGNVSPCCYLTTHSVRPYLKNPETENFVVGNIWENSLSRILSNEQYRKFVGGWMKNSIPIECKGCVQIARMGLNPVRN